MLDFDLPGMDVRTLSEQGVELRLRNEKGEPLLNRQGEQITMTVLGPESMTYRALMQEAAVARLQRLSVGQTLSFAEAQATTDRMLADCVTGWSGFTTTDGEPVEFSVEVARALFERYPNIRRQVDEFQSNRANFTLAS